MTTIWHTNSSNFFIDLTIDVEEHILFWTYDNCVYEHRILTGLTSLAWCDFNHPDSAMPTLISYYDNKLYIVIPLSIQNSQIYYYDEHRNEDGEYRFLGEEHIDDGIVSLKFNHHSVQPGNMSVHLILSFIHFFRHTLVFTNQWRM